MRRSRQRAADINEANATCAHPPKMKHARSGRAGTSLTSHDRVLRVNCNPRNASGHPMVSTPTLRMTAAFGAENSICVFSSGEMRVYAVPFCAGFVDDSAGIEIGEHSTSCGHRVRD